MDYSIIQFLDNSVFIKSIHILDSIIVPTVLLKDILDLHPLLESRISVSNVNSFSELVGYYKSSFPWADRKEMVSIIQKRISSTIDNISVLMNI